jgi:hypothetical protein
MAELAVETPDDAESSGTRGDVLSAQGNLSEALKA